MNIEVIKEALYPYFEQYQIDNVWLFGSYAKDTYTSSSDIDIVYEREKNYSFGHPLNILNFIDDIQHNALNLQVDVTNIRNIKNKDTAVSHSINNEKILIYRKDEYND